MPMCPRRPGAAAWSFGVGRVLRHTSPWLGTSRDGSPFDRVPADGDAGPYALSDAPAGGCAKSKRPVQRRLQVHRLPLQSILSQAGLSELDAVMVARAQSADNDLR